MIKSCVVKEELPYPYVYYPNHYGTFFLCLQKQTRRNRFFCSCAKQAIKNHFYLRKFEDDSQWSNPLIDAPLSSHFFPDIICQKSIKDARLEELIKFSDRICHRCNLRSLLLRYCHPMYGGNFKQYYGWYINNTIFRLGIRGFEYIKGYSPKEIIDILVEGKEHLRQLYELNVEFSQNFERIKELQSKLNSISTDVNRIAENITREEFGYSKVEEGNISESILAGIIENIFSEFEILRQIRPGWLEGLELDIFIPKINLGIEYQGQQHFLNLNKGLGGQESFGCIANKRC